jgi:membrane protease YdiL (CAAX protease family)
VLLVIIATAILALLFVTQLNRKDHFHVAPRHLFDGLNEILNFRIGMSVISLAAIQEEVLYRGYVLMNLSKLPPLIALLESTIIFTVVHFLTNRVNLHQIISWFISRLLLGAIYISSGSIVLAIIVHFVIDTSNVIVFNITCKFSMFTFTPALTERERTPFRLLYALTTLIILAVFYGPSIGLF